MRVFVTFLLALGLFLSGSMIVYAAAFNLGGIVVSPPIPCTPGVVFGFVGFINKVPYAGPVIWLPGTKPNRVTLGAPPILGQCVLGSVTPGACAIGLVPVVAPSLSPIPSPLPGFGTSIPGCKFIK